ncbi:hypothetical protein ACTJJE_13300, partial [Mycolicibacterium sp. 22603]|uniref:hypothetical protein n=1 Tax=Mycolicibacterium sp. 22603 TaxID=3453950 RepID=UPI003F86A73C
AASRGIGSSSPPGFSFFFSSGRQSDVTQRKQQRPSLRTVADDETVLAKKTAGKRAAVKRASAKRAPRKVTPVSVTAAARSGDRRQLLVALQVRVALALDDPATAGPAFAALIKQSRELSEAIAEIDRPPPERDTSGDWLEAIKNMPNEAWDESMI